MVRVSGIICTMCVMVCVIVCASEEATTTTTTVPDTVHAHVHTHAHALCVELLLHAHAGFKKSGSLPPLSRASCSQIGNSRTHSAPGHSLCPLFLHFHSDQLVEFLTSTVGGGEEEDGAKDGEERERLKRASATFCAQLAGDDGFLNSVSSVRREEGGREETPMSALGKSMADRVHLGTPQEVAKMGHDAAAQHLADIRARIRSARATYDATSRNRQHAARVHHATHSDTIRSTHTPSSHADRDDDGKDEL